MIWSDLQLLARDHAPLLAGVATASVAFVVAGALLGPFVISRLPRDYFCASHARRRPAARHPTLQFIVRVARNIGGLLLAVVGLLLLILPGQGILTLIAALLLMDVPTKRRHLRALVKRPGIRRALNWLRGRFGKEPFVWDAPRTETN